MNTDNQQQTVSDFEIGWVAGLIEGEGSVSLVICKRKGRGQQLRVTPRITVTNSDPALIGRYIDILGRLGIGKYVRCTKPNNQKLSRLFELQGGRSKFKDMTWVYVDGFKRMLRLLRLVTPHMFGDKKVRSLLLLKLIQKRVATAETVGKAANYSYDNEDISLMLQFLALTNSPNKDKIAGMLNEHTREAKRERRRRYKKEWHEANRKHETELQRLRRNRSRCALDS